MSDALELVWLDPKCTARIRRKPPWRDVLDAAEGAPVEAPSLPNQTVPQQDRRDVFLILAKAHPTVGDAVGEAVSEGMGSDGKFTPPLLLLEGQLTLSPDELETLKTTAANATPFSAGDEALRRAIDTANDYLQIPGLLPSPATIEALTGRIRTEFSRRQRDVPRGYLEAQTERTVLEQRQYQRRTFQGAPHLRGLLETGSVGGSLLMYLPGGAAPHLPLQQRFSVRLVAEGHVSTDANETHPFALRVLALARRIALPMARA